MIWKQYCESQYVPLFSSYHWLELVAKDEWDISLVFDSNNDIIGSLPYLIKKRNFLKIIQNPIFTSSLQLKVHFPESMKKHVSRRFFERNTYLELLNQMPSFDIFNIVCTVEQPYFFPFLKFKIDSKPRINYIIPPFENAEDIFAEFKGNVRTNIKKAEKNFTVISTQKLDAFLSFHQKINNKSNLSLNELSTLRLVFEYYVSINSAHCLYSYDSEGQLKSAILLVEDAQTVHYLMGLNDKSKHTDANTLLIWSVIKANAGTGKTFSFDGSVIPNVELFFSQFTGISQTPYHLHGFKNRFIKTLFTLLGKV